MDSKLPRVTVQVWTGDYIADNEKRDMPGHISLARFSSEQRIQCTTNRGATNVLARETNRDKRAPSFQKEKRITHRRSNPNDIVHVTVHKWEGVTHSTIYLVEMLPA